MERTIRYLKDSGAKQIKIFKPGYTKDTPAPIAKELTVSFQELKSFVQSMKKKYDVSLTMNPAVKKIPHIFDSLYKVLKELNGLKDKYKLFLCAESAKKALSLVLDRMEIKNYEIWLVKSKVFGGNVDCAGLLSVEDYILALKEFFKEKQDKKPDILVLPRGSFDINKEDLSMVPVQKIEGEFKIDILLV